MFLVGTLAERLAPVDPFQRPGSYRFMTGNFLLYHVDHLQYSRRHVSINRAAPRLPTTNSRRDCDILAWENRGDDVGLAWRGVARRGRGAERRG